MQNQGIISYIFPHFGLKAQPIAKTEAYASVFFVSAVFCKIKEATGGFFILTVRRNYKSG